MVAIARPLFPLGQIVATPAAMAVLAEANDDAAIFLARHVAGDWGDICLEDKSLNDAALTDGGRLLSVYRTSKGVTLWIITEADRSVTTILLPEDY